MRNGHRWYVEDHQRRRCHTVGEERKHIYVDVTGVDETARGNARNSFTLLRGTVLVWTPLSS